MKTISIAVPDDVYEKLNKLQSYYGATTLSNLFVLGFDTLNWIKTKTDDKCVVTALAKENNTLIYECVPIKKISEIGLDIKNIIIK